MQGNVLFFRATKRQRLNYPCLEMYFAIEATRAGKTAGDILSYRKRMKTMKEMNSKNEVEIQNINNPFEKEILLFLKRKGKCIYGDIFKELKISGTRGQEAVYSLLTKGFIKHRDKTSYIELNVALKT